ncbi:malonyl-ACP O-methyltransferase BioC [Candidatus Sororendozoicomonas aggregata]|uniref:malonyl-ACP O-methyltransferase BioC n=1 Tax=Candidatus Sororendozoicomonas aggregata TaxID=3073239 RepID=UPI002ED0EB23
MLATPQEEAPLGNARTRQQFKKRVQTHFSKAATSYDAAALLQQRVAEHTHLLIPPSQVFSRILDVGSGTGYQTRQLRRRYPNANITGIDLAIGMAQYASAQTPCHHPIHWAVGDMECLPFQSDTFDLVYSSLAIQWGELSHVLQEIKRVLKPGGLFVFSSLLCGTMVELKTAWQQVDDESRMNRFKTLAEKQQVFEQLHMPLNHVHRRWETLFYPSVRAMLGELKALGVNVAQSPARGLMTRHKLNALGNAYEVHRQPQGLPLSYEVVYGQVNTR